MKVLRAAGLVAVLLGALALSGCQPAEGMKESPVPPSQAPPMKDPNTGQSTGNNPGAAPAAPTLPPPPTGG